MKESKVVKFVKNHSKELVIAGVGMVACAAGVYYGRKLGLNERPIVSDNLIEIGREIDFVRGNAVDYVGATSYDIFKAFPDGLDVTDPDGRTLRITGALLFGDIVEK